MTLLISGGVCPISIWSRRIPAELAKQLKSRGIDVAFAAMTPEAAGLNHVHVWSQSLVACVNVENPLAQRTSITLDELKDERLAHL